MWPLLTNIKPVNLNTVSKPFFFVYITWTCIKSDWWNAQFKPLVFPCHLSACLPSVYLLLPQVFCSFPYECQSLTDLKLYFCFCLYTVGDVPLGFLSKIRYCSTLSIIWEILKWTVVIFQHDCLFLNFGNKLLFYSI